MAQEPPAPAAPAAAKVGKTARPANCPQCNKRMSQKHWYYRNGQFYCSKRCWKKGVVEAAKKSAQAQPAPAAPAA